MKKIIAFVRQKPELLITSKEIEKKLQDELSVEDTSYELIKFIRSLAKFEYNYLSNKTKTFISIHKNNKKFEAIMFYLEQIPKLKDTFQKKLALTNEFFELILDKFNKLIDQSDNSANLKILLSVKEYLKNTIHCLVTLTTNSKTMDHRFPDLSNCLLNENTTFQSFLEISELLDDFIFDIELRNIADTDKIYYINSYGMVEEKMKTTYLLQLALLLHNQLEHIDTKIYQNNENKSIYNLDFIFIQQPHLLRQKEKFINKLNSLKELIFISLQKEATQLIDADESTIPILHWAQKIQMKDNLIWKLKTMSHLNKIKLDGTTFKQFFEQDLVLSDPITSQKQKLSHIVSNMAETIFFPTPNESISYYELEKLNTHISNCLESINEFIKIVKTYKPQGPSSTKVQLNRDKNKLLTNLEVLTSKLTFHQNMISVWNIIDETTFEKFPQNKSLLKVLKNHHFIENNKLSLCLDNYETILSNPELELSHQEKINLNQTFKSLTHVSLAELESLKEYSNSSTRILKELKQTIHTHLPDNLKESMLTLLTTLIDKYSQKTIDTTKENIQLKQVLEYLKLIFNLQLNTIENLLQKLNIPNPITKDQFLNTVITLLENSDIELEENEKNVLKELKEILKQKKNFTSLNKKIDLRQIHAFGIKNERDQIVEKILHQELNDELDIISNKDQPNKKKKAKQKKKENKINLSPTPIKKEEATLKEDNELVLKKEQKNEKKERQKMRKAEEETLEHIRNEKKNLEIEKEKEFRKQEHITKKAAKKLAKEREKIKNECDQMEIEDNLSKHLKEIEDKPTLFNTLQQTKKEELAEPEIEHHLEKFNIIQQILHQFTHIYDLRLPLQKTEQFKMIFTDATLNKLSSERKFTKLIYDNNLQTLFHTEQTYKEEIIRLSNQLLDQANILHLQFRDFQNVGHIHHFHKLTAYFKEASLIHQDFLENTASSQEEYYPQQLIFNIHKSVEDNIKISEALITQLNIISENQPMIKGLFNEWKEKLFYYIKILPILINSNKILELKKTNKCLYIYIRETQTILTKFEELERQIIANRKQLEIQNQLALQQQIFFEQQMAMQELFLEEQNRINLTTHRNNTKQINRKNKKEYN